MEVRVSQRRSLTEEENPRMAALTELMSRQLALALEGW